MNKTDNGRDMSGPFFGWLAQGLFIIKKFSENKSVDEITFEYIDDYYFMINDQIFLGQVKASTTNTYIKNENIEEELAKMKNKLEKSGRNPKKVSVLISLMHNNNIAKGDLDKKLLDSFQNVTIDNTKDALEDIIGNIKDEVENELFEIEELKIFILGLIGERVYNKHQKKMKGKETKIIFKRDDYKKILSKINFNQLIANIDKANTVALSNEYPISGTKISQLTSLIGNKKAQRYYGWASNYNSFKDTIINNFIYEERYFLSKESVALDDLEGLEEENKKETYYNWQIAINQSS